jgi:putative hydroxymethylpyrimidine transport system substrate-binding protein
MRVRLSIALGVAAAVAVLLGGCGAESDAGTSSEQSWLFETLELNLNWEPGPENVGPLLANELGYFSDVKLGVYVNTPLAPERPTKYVDEELTDAAIVPAPQVVQAQEEGRSVVAVGSLLSETTMSLTWLSDSGIDEVADLAGKTIAYPGVPFQKDFLEYVLEGAGLTLADVKLEDVGYELVAALDSGVADATFGGSGVEQSTLLEARGLDPVVTGATNLGIPEYDELLLIVQPGRNAREPELFQRLLDASVRGNRTATENARAATKAIVDQSEGKIPAKPTEAGVEATAPLLSEDGGIDPARLGSLVDWMFEQGMIERRIPVSQLIAGNDRGDP